jgi:hypothetical protein
MLVHARLSPAASYINMLFCKPTIICTNHLTKFEGLKTQYVYQDDYAVKMLSVGRN